jgi:hypothetical protein
MIAYSTCTTTNERKMSNADRVLTPGNDESTPGLDIPEARDGFYGYSEEKTQQHVRRFLMAKTFPVQWCPAD